MTRKKLIRAKPMAHKIMGDFKQYRDWEKEQMKEMEIQAMKTDHVMSSMSQTK
mgnify:CR=1 FL=1